MNKSNWLKKQGSDSGHLDKDWSEMIDARKWSDVVS